jgi:hypothetical protein
MRTSLNEIREIEEHLLLRSRPDNSLLFEARLILDKDLREKLLWQKKTYAVIQLYGRRRLKNEIEAVHEKLFNEPAHEGFRNKIMKLFTR